MKLTIRTTFAYLKKLALVIAVCCASLASAADQLTFVIADGASEPYQIVSANPAREPHSGILMDLLSKALADSAIEIVAVVRPYKRIKLELLAQRYSRWISYGSPSWLDERVLALGEYSEVPVLESAYTLANLVEFGEPMLGSVRGKKVIVIHGYSYYPSFYHWVAANNMQLIYAPSHRHALAMLKQYRGDYYLAETIRIRWQARQSGVPLAELHLIDFSSIIPPSVVYFLFDKRIPLAVRQRLNERLRQLQQTGELARVIARYQ